MSGNVVIRVTVENTAPTNGNFLTPVWIAFHDGSFDQFDIGSPASMGIERIAEDGTIPPLGMEFQASGAGSIAAAIFGAGGPIAAGETASTLLALDGDAATSRFFTYASMVIPSNDAFIGNDDPMAVRIFADDGSFLGADFTVLGSDVLDAGTELNTEIPSETAFLGQAAPNTGQDEGGVITNHPGFTPGGTILSTEMFAGADFEQPGYQLARFIIEVIEDAVAGSAGADTLDVTREDDVVLAAGGDDSVIGRDGDDDLRGDGGNDALRAGRGDDSLNGGAGNDILSAGAGDDLLQGGAGADRLRGRLGDDTLDGGAGDDVLTGGEGDDDFIVAIGGGNDVITDFADGDMLRLNGFGFADAAAALGVATEDAEGVTFVLAGGSLLVSGAMLADFSETNLFV